MMKSSRCGVLQAAPKPDPARLLLWLYAVHAIWLAFAFAWLILACELPQLEACTFGQQPTNNLHRKVELNALELPVPSFETTSCLGSCHLSLPYALF